MQASQLKRKLSDSIEFDVDVHNDSEAIDHDDFEENILAIGTDNHFSSDLVCELEVAAKNEAHFICVSSNFQWR